MTAIRFLDRNKMVVYASENGVPMDASLSDPTVGTDASTALQALIDTVAAAGGGTVIIDGACKCHDVKLRSGIAIQGASLSSWTGSGAAPKVGIIQSPRSQCIFRNTNWTSAYNGGTPVTNFSTIVDHDIAVRNLFLNGNRGNGGVNNAAGGNSNINTTGLNDGFNNPSLLFIAPFIFLGVRNLQVDNVVVYDPGARVLTAAYLDGFAIRNVSIFCPPVFNGLTTPTTISSTSGGISVSGTARNGVIRGVTGFCGGNVVAVFCDAFPTNTSSARAPTAYYSVLYPGPITDVEVSGINMTLADTACAIWSGNRNAEVTQTFSSLLDRVAVHDVTGTYYGANVIGVDGPSAILGTHGDESFYNMSLKIVQGPNNFRGLFAEGSHNHISFKNVYIDVSGVTGWDGPSLPTATTFWFNFSAPGLFLEMDDITIYSTSSIAFDAVQVVARADRTRLSRVTVTRTQTAAGSVLRLAGACSVVEAMVTGVVADRVSNVVLFDSGTVTNLTTSGIVHLNANGGASIQVTTQTLPRLRCSGSNTLLLTATATGGTITSKKTDATEDA